MAKDLYSTLGVSRTESLHGIREAFRKLAKRYHPDHAGQQGTLKFQEILNAYEVLSDPEKRKSTRLNSSHVAISYAVFCLKKKKKKTKQQTARRDKITT